MVTCRYAVPLGAGRSSTDTNLIQTVNAAIFHVVSEQPLLLVGIEDADSKKPAWVQIENVDPYQHIEWRDLQDLEQLESSVQEVLSVQLDIRFPDLKTRPGWRVLVLNLQGTGCLEIAFIYNHTNVDGTSGKLFHENLVRRLNMQGAGEGEPPPQIQVPKSLYKLSPPTEQWANFSQSPSFLVKEVWKEFRPAVLSNRPTQAKWAPIRAVPRTTAMKAFSIDGSVLSRILVACREHKTTIAGVCHGLALVSFASHLNKKMAPGFEAETPMNLRRILPRNHPKYSDFVPDRTMGNYVTLIYHEFDTALVSRLRSELGRKTATTPGTLTPSLMKLVWKAATKVRGEIQHRLDGGPHNEIAGLMKFVADWRAEMRGKVSRPRDFSWAVNTLGVMDGQGLSGEAPDDGKAWSIRQAQLGMSADALGPTMYFNILTVAGGPMTVSCSWQDCILDANLARAITTDMENWLLQIGS